MSGGGRMSTVFLVLMGCMVISTEGAQQSACGLAWCTTAVPAKVLRGLSPYIGPQKALSTRLGTPMRGCCRNVLAAAMQAGDDSFSVSADISEYSASDGDKTGMGARNQQQVLETRSRVLSSCAGLDRGSSASREDRGRVEKAVRDLEGLYDPSTSPWPMAMEGSWRLIYSSAFSPGSGSGGGASANSPPIFQTPDRGGFPGGLGPLSPVIIGAVYQDVSFARETLNNVVEFTLRVPGISFLLPQSVSVVRASLIHKLERVMSQERRVRIILTDIEATYKEGPLTGLSPPPLSLPVIQQISEQGPGVFDTTYCDDEIRVSRGDRGEIRVFTKEP